MSFNPNSARTWHNSGTVGLWAGQLDVAIEHLKTALRLSPRARVGTSLAVMGGAYLISRRFDEAVPKLLLAIQDDPTNPHPYRYLAACYALMGRPKEACEVVASLRAITPHVVPTMGYLRNEHRELLVVGLRLAMGETT